jgi:hypothetical protein
MKDEMTIERVVNQWARGGKGYAGPLMSDGRGLYSYGVLIAIWTDQGFAITSKKYSTTTSRHTNMARKAAIESVGAENVTTFEPVNA